MVFRVLIRTENEVEVDYIWLRAVFSSVGLREGLKLARGGVKKPPHDRAPVF